MKNANRKGFTLIELLIVIAIIGILAAVLIPNLLNARERAFDTGAQTCLKELGVEAEVAASINPFNYANAPAFAAAAIPARQACANVSVIGGPSADPFATYTYDARHVQSPRGWRIQNGTGVVASAVVPAIP